MLVFVGRQLAISTAAVECVSALTERGMAKSKNGFVNDAQWPGPGEKFGLKSLIPIASLTLQALEAAGSICAQLKGIRCKSARKGRGDLFAGRSFRHLCAHRPPTALTLWSGPSNKHRLETKVMRNPSRLLL